MRGDGYVFKSIEPGIPHKQRGDTDPAVGTYQLEKAILEFMKDAWDNRDLPTVFRNLELSAGWYTAPSKSVVHLAKLKCFYRVMFRLFSNGMLPNRRLEDALKNLEHHRDASGALPYKWN